MNTVVFAGTTEGRQLSESLSAAGIDHIVCVATEYGSQLIKDDAHTRVRMGRLSPEQMEQLFVDERISRCIDATHPFATEVTANIKGACKNRQVEYIRVKRKDTGLTDEGIKYFGDHESCAKALGDTAGNIMLTTGSKDLATYCANDEIRSRLYARVLPGSESIGLCESAGIPGGRIIAMQGPFSERLNESLIRDLNIQVMVSKQSGQSGGFFEKLAACESTGIEMFVVGIPLEDEGIDIQRALELYGVKDERPASIALIGIGMGNTDTLISGAREWIETSDHVLGAKRILDSVADICRTKSRKADIYMPGDILSYIRDNVETAQKVAILFSGDTGFYSGAKKLALALDLEISKGLKAVFSVMPGISSVSYFASKLHESYDDAAILSLHGRKDKTSSAKLLKAVRENKKVFVLMSGAGEVAEVVRELKREGLSQLRINAACNLSYPDESITLVDEENVDSLPEGLYVLFIENRKLLAPYVSGYVSDNDYIRARVPMTKQSVRSLSISALKLRANSILYDIGAGTGSISIEAAMLSPDMRIYAFEKNPEAVGLIRENCAKFGVDNIRILQGNVPESFDLAAEIPAPTHVFIGGSSGNMQEIVKYIYSRNPSCRIIVNAVSLQTLSEIMAIRDTLPCEYFDIRQVSVTNVNKVGSYDMLKAENPIWICEIQLSEKGEQGV